ncbi:hypothetical protein GQ54DRAFT_312727 [Martensiomyces pterosporus]|nr:hypothetical protein GQ54DRAFT_312727 [Martensiomyces pterosporus]
MQDLTVEFEAMMANVTAPPLSLDEFRMFVSHDPEARHALAFCEWYQRYQAVYFDRITVPSTRRTAASSRAGIPPDFGASDPRFPLRSLHLPVDRASTRSISAPNVRTCVQNGPAPDNLYTLKSHSFSALSESMISSAFNTTSTGSSGGSGASEGSSGCQAARKATDPAFPSYRGDIHDTTSYYAAAFAATGTSSHASRNSTPNKSTAIGRRCTLPVAACDFVLESHVKAQEESRRQIQSLLVFECWARFLTDDAKEQFEIPEAELLYVKERLPLNVTHIPHPLLCKNDMLASLTSVTATNDSSAGAAAPKSSVLNHSSKPESTATLQLAPHRSLQFQPFQQLKRSLISQVQLRRVNLSHIQSPLSLSFGIKDIASDSDSDGGSDGGGELSAAAGADSMTAKELLAGLRRISTMPTLRFGKTVLNRAAEVSARPAGARLAAPATRARRLVSVGELQGYHYTLRPRPPFATISSGGARAMQVGYRPVPASISKLIVLNSVPPALFETIAKVAADHLLQRYFADFYEQSHYNMTTPQRQLSAVLALSLLLFGCGVAVVLVVCKVHLAWRTFALPFLFAAAVCAVSAWTRVSILSWWQRKRPTSFVTGHSMVSFKDDEKAVQADTRSDIDLCAVREITGTLAAMNSYVLAGTVFSIGSYTNESGFLGGKRSSPSKTPALANLGSASAVSLWSHLTVNAAIHGIFGVVTRFLLRGKSAGDQWVIDLEGTHYQVIEPYVLCGQCYIVSHQLAVLCVAWAAAAIALYLVA